MIHFDEYSSEKNVRQTLTIEEAILKQRTLYENSNVYAYGIDGDKLALNDFKSHNLAWESPDCIHHDNSVGQCIIGRSAPIECITCSARCSCE